MATEQFSEVLDLGGVSFDIHEVPLVGHPHYGSLVEKLNIGSGICSAAWRGYKGIWVIDNDKLYLQLIIKNPCNQDPEYLKPAELIEQNESDGFASWYSGDISFRISRKSYFDKSVDGKSGVEYEAVVFKIENGKVLSRTIEQVQHLWK